MSITLMIIDSERVFLFTTGIQCLVADCPQVLGLSLWSESRTKQQGGLWGHGGPLKVQLKFLDNEKREI